MFLAPKRIFTSYVLWIILSIIPCFSIDNSSFSIDDLEKIRSEVASKNFTPNQAKTLSILNVSYDPTRELYNAINPLFIKYWKEKTGQNLEIYMSHGGSGSQARAVLGGLQADVVTLALSTDIDILGTKDHYISKDWQSRLPNNSCPYTSTIIFLVRKGNPKHIKDWDDLVKEGIQVITPNPKISGAARWNYLAAWGYALKKYGSEEKAHEFIKKLYLNVPVMDTGARNSTSTFVQRNIGDVLINWENEVYLAQNAFDKDNFEIVIPSTSVSAETPVTVVDKNVNHHKTKDVAETYLKFLYTKEAQEIIAKKYYRPIDPEVMAKYKDVFKNVQMMNIRDFGGWQKFQKEHFGDGGLFDTIFQAQIKKIKKK